MEYSEEKFLNQQAYVNRLYRQQEKNTNLTLEQHRLIQEISTIRHKLHSVGWKVYAGRPVTREIRNFFRKSPKDFLELGLPYPRAAFDTYRTMETVNDLLKFSNPSEIEVKNSCTMFIQEKEFINEIFQGYLENIDSEYGTSYAPKGHRKTMELKD